MPFQPVVNTAEATFHFLGDSGGSLAGSEAQFGLYVRDTVTGWNTAQLDLLADYCGDWWTTGKNAGTPLRDEFSAQWVLGDVTAHDLGSASGLTVVNTLNDPGTRAGDPVAASHAVLMRMFGTAGQPVPRNWNFWNAGVEADISGNLWSQAFVDGLADRLTDWRTDLDNAGAGGFATWAHVAVSRNLGTQPDPDPPRIPIRRATAVTGTIGSVEGRREVASQRDRRPSA